MSPTCSECDSEVEVRVKQRPLCETHATEHLGNLREDKTELQAEVDRLQSEHNDICDKYNVGGYGELEHQFSVEEREDVDESDVDRLNEVDAALAAAKNDLTGIKQTIDKLDAKLA